MKKRVREEAQSITANCNVKIFGKLEDPTETKEFFEKTTPKLFLYYCEMNEEDCKVFNNTQPVWEQVPVIFGIIKYDVVNISQLTEKSGWNNKWNVSQIVISHLFLRCLRWCHLPFA